MVQLCGGGAAEMKRSALMLALALAAAAPAYAEPNGGPSAPALRPLCPDRPSKGTSACTVDAGHLQLETDLFNETYDRDAGITNRTIVVVNPTLKLGLTDNFDIEANLAAYVRSSTYDGSSGARAATSSVGDLYLRAKLNLAGNSGGDLGLAIEPFVKAPVAKAGVGNRAWEGGLVVPVSYNLPMGWSLGLTPEADVLLNGSGSGRHLALELPVGLNHAIGPLQATVELWTSQDFDPAGTTRQYSLDFAAAWQPKARPDLQLDGGVNLGLNRATPDVQVYVGLAHRF
jgi:hypothetical protein